MSKRIAIVHDALVVPAGSERLALQISNIFPDAPIFTSVYIPENTYPEFKSRKVIQLPYARIATNERHFKSLYPLWFKGFTNLDLSEFDTIISSANYLAKFINLPSTSTHICYLHNPIRFLWKPQSYSDKSIPYGKASLLIIRFLGSHFKKIDIKATQRIKHIVTNSKNIANQIKRIYQRKADVIYPPVDINAYHITKSSKDYYLYAGRLISHKRVDLAIKACNQLNRKLIIAGDGLERSNLERISGNSIKFTGRVSDQELKNLYANCRALIFPSNEDFGLVPVEAQASGRPVIAYRGGGALETIIEYQTGVFFNDQEEASIIDAILKFEGMVFNSATIRQNATRFDIRYFQQQMREYIETHS